MTLSNYLFFTTQCEAALRFYESCGVGSVRELRRHGDSGSPVHREDMRGKVMHAEFAGPGVHFFASDNHDAEPMRGSAMMFSLADEAETRGLFGKLAQGGTVTTRLGVQPWGDFYGKLTDQFGVQWMFNCRRVRNEAVGNS
jgi:PhnB protein